MTTKKRRRGRVGRYLFFSLLREDDNDVDEEDEGDFVKFYGEFEDDDGGDDKEEEGREEG